MSNALTVFQKPKELTDFLASGRSAFQKALPAHLNADRLIRLAVTAWSTNASIRNCTGQSIMASVMVAAQLGLEPGIAGQGYLIPYGKNCTFVPGWQGMVGLLNNTGRATAWTGAVFEGDEWEFALGSQPRCRHIPGPNFGDSAKLIWVYACGKVNGSEQPVVEAWPMSRVWAHRDKFNKVGAKHYSFQHPEMYARKVVLLQVLKYMPRSVELNNAIVAANADEAGRATRVEEGVVIDVPSEIPQANVGNGERTPLEDAKPLKQAKPAKTEPEPPREEETSQSTYVEGGDTDPEPEESKGPSAAELKAGITRRMADMNIGKKMLNGALVGLKIIEEGQSWDAQDAATLLAIEERWDEVQDFIKNS